MSPSQPSFKRNGTTPKKLKQQWSGNAYDPTQVIDSAVLTAQPNDTDSWSSLRLIALMLVAFAVGLVFLLAVDGLMLAQARMHFSTLERKLLQDDWTLNSSAIQLSTLDAKKLNLKAEAKLNLIQKTQFDAPVISYVELSELPDQYSFLSRNSFEIIDKKGFIYLTPTNFAGRVFSSLAKNFEVAIILRTAADFKLPESIKARGLKVIAHKRMSKLGLSLFKLEIPAQEWNWFSRFIIRTVL